MWYYDLHVVVRCCNYIWYIIHGRDIFCGRTLSYVTESQIIILIYVIPVSRKWSFNLFANPFSGRNASDCINKLITFFSECLTKFGDSIGLQIWDAVNDCFDAMPIAATIDDKVSSWHVLVTIIVYTISYKYAAAVTIHVCLHCYNDLAIGIINC